MAAFTEGERLGYEQCPAGRAQRAGGRLGLCKESWNQGLKPVRVAETAVVLHLVDPGLGPEQPVSVSSRAGVSLSSVVKLSRHARNELRLYRIDRQDVEATMKEPTTQETDERGNRRLTGETTDGRPILVVVAADDPDFVITAFLRS